MSRKDLHYLISILLICSVSVTGVLGYIQSELELRKFVPHRYFAYTTLSLAFVHVLLNGGKIVKYLRTKLRARNG
jgi:hypothetical protein